MRNEAKLIEEYKELYCGIKKQMAIVCGEIKIRYRSRIIVNGKLKTKYYKNYYNALNHKKEELIKLGKVIKLKRPRIRRAVA